MIIVRGNKTSEINKQELTQYIDGFTQVIIDLGTGDANYVYKNAVANPANFYIGVEPIKKQFEPVARKIIRNKIKNAMLVVGSFELLPPELSNAADKVTVNLPWGSLLQQLVKPNTEILNKLKSLFKSHGKLEMLIGYSPLLEPGETKRLDLEELNEEYIKSTMLPIYINYGFSLDQLEKVSENNMTEINSSWIKKIRGQDKRQLFILKLTI